MFSGFFTRSGCFPLIPTHQYQNDIDIIAFGVAILRNMYQSYHYGAYRKPDFPAPNTECRIMASANADFF